MMGTGPFGLTPFEVACGLVFGVERPLARLPALEAGEYPLVTLEDAIRPALERPPCLVSFSGGRDSSAVLAVATRLAEREGLPPPIPVTNRFPLVEKSQESEWQEQVVAYLGLEEWSRLEFEDELDVVGPYATRALRRHGLIWPFNAHFHLPLIEAAAGGSLLTGAGGDEILSSSTWFRATRVLSARVKPTPRDVLRVGFALSPRSIRRRVIRGRAPTIDLFAWLHDDVRRRAFTEWADEGATEPLRWRERCRWLLSLRYIRLGLSSLGFLAGDNDVHIVHPLADPRFVAAIAAIPARNRFEGRSEAMLGLFAGLLPEKLLTRGSKASFDRAFWSRHSRELVERWEGQGIDEELVDGEALRAMWATDDPDPRSFTLLQAVWLALEDGARSARGDLEQAVTGERQRVPASGAADLPAGQPGEREEGGGVARGETDSALG
jgi:asparagine synthetase B (glutamine-hydrolysing)